MLRLLHFSGKKKQVKATLWWKGPLEVPSSVTAQFRANFIVQLGCALIFVQSGFEGIQRWHLPPFLAFGIAAAQPPGPSKVLPGSSGYQHLQEADRQVSFCLCRIM